MDAAGSRQENMDPDYENPGAELRKRQRVMELDAKDFNVKKIVRILTEQFGRAIDDKEQEALEIDRRLNEARLTMDSLRACIVAKYYSAPAAEPAAGGSQQSAIHPAVKQLSGKKPLPATGLDAAVASACRRACDGLPRRDISSPTAGSAVAERSFSAADEPSPRGGDARTPNGVAAAARAALPPPNGKLTKRLVVGNVSKYLPDDRRDEKDAATHKWMIYVRGPREQPDVSAFVKKVWFFLHPSYKPNDLVEVSRPPFHLTRRGWGEFPVRVQVHLNDARGRKVDVIHNLKLDRTYTGLQTLGAETHVDVELELAALTATGPGLAVSSAAPLQPSPAVKPLPAANPPAPLPLPCGGGSVRNSSNSEPSSGRTYDHQALAGPAADAVVATAAESSQPPALTQSSASSSASLPSSSSQDDELSGLSAARRGSDKPGSDAVSCGSAATGGALAYLPSAVDTSRDGGDRGNCSGELTAAQMPMATTSAADVCRAVGKKTVDAVNVSLLRHPLVRQPPAVAANGPERGGGAHVSLVPCQPQPVEQVLRTDRAPETAMLPVYVRCQDVSGRQYLIKREALGAGAVVGGCLRLVNSMVQVSDGLKVLLANGVSASPARVAAGTPPSISETACGGASDRLSDPCHGQRAAAEVGSALPGGRGAASAVGHCIFMPSLKAADFPNMGALIGCLAKRCPLVLDPKNSSSRVDGTGSDDPPPYCAPSYEVFLSWPLGKRRACEWLRARDVRKWAAELLGRGDEAGLHGEQLWSTKRIVLWCRLHMHSPENVLHVHEFPASASRISSEIVIRCMPSANVLSDASSRERCEPLVDIVSAEAPAQMVPASAVSAYWSGSSRCVDSNGDGCSVVAEIDLTDEQLFVRGLIGQLGIRTAPHWTAVPTADRSSDVQTQPACVATCEAALYGAMLAFCEDLLRHAAAAAKVKLHAAEITVADVIDAIQAHEQYDFLSDQYMGE